MPSVLVTTCKLLEQPGHEEGTISWLEEEMEGLRIRSILIAYLFLGCSTSVTEARSCRGEDGGFQVVATSCRNLMVENAGSAPPGNKSPTLLEVIDRIKTGSWL